MMPIHTPKHACLSLYLQTACYMSISLLAEIGMGALTSEQHA